MPGVKLTTQAYCKMVLHGAKYPHCAVNGLLVAEKQKPRKDHLPLSGPGAHHTLFVDCIPLFHGTLALAPMLEVALTLVSVGTAPGRPSEIGLQSVQSASTQSHLEADRCLDRSLEPTFRGRGDGERMTRESAWIFVRHLGSAPQMAARHSSGPRSYLNGRRCF